MSKVQEKPSALKREHPALQKMKFNIKFFLFLWVIYAFLDPDPDPGIPFNPNPKHRDKVCSVVYGYTLLAKQGFSMYAID
jgi:hypothetical protein